MIKIFLLDELISAYLCLKDGICWFLWTYLDLASKGNKIFLTLCAEELGLVLEESKKNLDLVMDKLNIGSFS